MRMRRAWVLVNAILGKEYEALEDLRKLPGVKEAHLITGQYDIILLIEA